MRFSCKKVSLSLQRVSGEIRKVKKIKKIREIKKIKTIPPIRKNLYPSLIPHKEKIVFISSYLL